MSAAVINLTQSFATSITHVLTSQLVSTTQLTASSIRPPSSPSQLVLKPREKTVSDAALLDGRPSDENFQPSSPFGSTTDIYHDCSEMPSSGSNLSSSFENESPGFEQPEMPSSNGDVDVDSSSSWHRQCLIERHLRQSAEAEAQELQAQLDAIRHLVLSALFDGGTAGLVATDSKSAELQTAVSALIEHRQAVSKSLTELEEEIVGECEAARLASAVCARAAAIEDLREQWREEKEVLERRLEQSARMVEAMLKHSKDNSKQLEPWRQQLLNGALSVGCLVLGAAAAGLIITRMNASTAL